MSEFKFSCPSCGQNLLCDTAHEGSQIICPGCRAALEVPRQTSGPAPASVPADGPPPLPDNLAAHDQRTSRLAIASLVCSLSSLITCVGWLPGVICGHLAKSRIRRNPLLKGSGLATAGLVSGYLILLVEVSTAAVHIWRFPTAMKQGFENVQQHLATNHITITQTHSSNTSPDQPPIVPAGSEWISDISQALFPDRPAGGTLHGIPFIASAASFRNGDLRLSSADGNSVEITRLGKSIEGRYFEIRSTDDTNANPHVKLTWNEGGVVRSETFGKGYGMKLRFDQAANRKVSGQIFLCFPDDSRSYVGGTFEVRLPKPK